MHFTVKDHLIGIGDSEPLERNFLQHAFVVYGQKMYGGSVLFGYFPHLYIYSEV